MPGRGGSEALYSFSAFQQPQSRSLAFPASHFATTTLDKTASSNVKTKGNGQHSRRLLDCVGCPGAAPIPAPAPPPATHTQVPASPHSSAATFSLRRTSPQHSLAGSWDFQPWVSPFSVSSFFHSSSLLWTGPQAGESGLFTPSPFGLPKPLSLVLQWALGTPHLIGQSSPLKSI